MDGPKDVVFGEWGTVAYALHHGAVERAGVELIARKEGLLNCRVHI